MDHGKCIRLCVKTEVAGRWSSTGGTNQAIYYTSLSVSNVLSEHTSWSPTFVRGNLGTDGQGLNVCEELLAYVGAISCFSGVALFVADETHFVAMSVVHVDGFVGEDGALAILQVCHGAVR